MNRLFVAITIVVSLAGCASIDYQPQKLEVCTTYVLYADIAALIAARGKETDGFYNRWRNEVHVVKWDFEAAGHELYHAMSLKGWPEKLIIDKGYEHWDNE